MIDRAVSVYKMINYFKDVLDGKDVEMTSEKYNKRLNIFCRDKANLPHMKSKNLDTIEVDPNATLDAFRHFILLYNYEDTNNKTAIDYNSQMFGSLLNLHQHIDVLYFSDKDYTYNRLMNYLQGNENAMMITKKIVAEMSHGDAQCEFNVVEKDADNNEILVPYMICSHEGKGYIYRDCHNIDLPLFDFTGNDVKIPYAIACLRYPNMKNSKLVYTAMRNSLSHEIPMSENDKYHLNCRLYDNRFTMEYSGEWIDNCNEFMVNNCYKLDCETKNGVTKNCYNLLIPTFIGIDKKFNYDNNQNAQENLNRLRKFLSKVDLINISVPENVTGDTLKNIEKYFNDIKATDLSKEKINSSKRLIKFISDKMKNLFQTNCDVNYLDKVNDDMLTNWVQRIGDIKEYSELSFKDQIDVLKNFIVVNPEYYMTGNGFGFVKSKTVYIMKDFLSTFNDPSIRETHYNSLMNNKILETQNYFDIKMRQKEKELDDVKFDRKQELIDIKQEAIEKAKSNGASRDDIRSNKTVVNKAIKQYIECEKNENLEVESAYLKNKIDIELNNYHKKLQEEDVDIFAMKDYKNIRHEMTALLATFKAYSCLVETGYLSAIDTGVLSSEEYFSLGDLDMSKFNVKWLDNDLVSYKKNSEILGIIKNAICHKCIDFIPSKCGSVDDMQVVIGHRPGHLGEKNIDGNITISVKDFMDFFDNEKFYCTDTQKIRKEFNKLNKLLGNDTIIDAVKEFNNFKIKSAKSMKEDDVNNDEIPKDKCYSYPSTQNRKFKKSQKIENDNKYKEIEEYIISKKAREVKEHDERMKSKSKTKKCNCGMGELS